jgi:hypothetical protein
MEDDDFMRRGSVTGFSVAFPGAVPLFGGRDRPPWADSHAILHVVLCDAGDWLNSDCLAAWVARAHAYIMLYSYSSPASVVQCQFVSSMRLFLCPNALCN